MPGVDGIRSFRALRKVALRRFGLRAIDARELDERAFVFPSHPPRSTRETTMSEFSERIRNQKTGLFKVADFAGDREATLTIDHLEEKVEMFNEEVDVLCFVETKQQLRLNQTTAEFLLDANVDSSESRPGAMRRSDNARRPLRRSHLDRYAVSPPSVVFFADDDGAD